MMGVVRGADGPDLALLRDDERARAARRLARNDGGRPRLAADDGALEDGERRAVVDEDRLLENDLGLVVAPGRIYRDVPRLDDDLRARAAGESDDGESHCERESKFVHRLVIPLVLGFGFRVPVSGADGTRCERGRLRSVGAGGRPICGHSPTVFGYLFPTFA